MAGLLLGCLPLPAGLGALPARKGALGLGVALEEAQHSQARHLRGASSCIVIAAAADGLGAAADCGGASGTSMAVGSPPRSRVSNHTRRLVVPAYCLAGTRTRRRRGPGGAGGDDDDELGGGDGGSGFWGGDGGDGGGDPWGSGGEGEGDGSLAARLQDLLLLWSLFCALAFAQTVAHVTPKPKAVAPAFAAMSCCTYTGIKAQLLQRRGDALTTPC